MPHPQERQRCSLLTDSILLHEMAEELRRDRKPQGARPEGAVLGTGSLQEDKEHNIPFQDVLK